MAGTNHDQVGKDLELLREHQVPAVVPGSEPVAGTKTDA
jgi:hypothetical protein